MTTEEMRECVHRGMEFLTLHFPGWLDKINVDKLDARDWDFCPLGQASWTERLDYWQSAGLHKLSGSREQQPLGFRVKEFDISDDDEMDEQYRLLTKIWKEEITKARSANANHRQTQIPVGG